MSVPSISVIMPTYNRARFLPESIGSILAQTVPILELIVVDDGSTDETGQVLADLRERFVGMPGPPSSASSERLRVLHQANAGPAAARARGLDAATGSVVALLDSDDVWEPEHLASSLHALEASGETGLAHGPARIMNGDGVLTGAVWARPEYQGEVRERLLIQNGVNASSVVALRRHLLAAGSWDPTMPCLENWELWIRVSRQCHFAWVEAPQVRYRIHGDNLIKHLDKQRRAYARLLEKHLCAEGESPVPLPLRRRALARYHSAFADAHVGRGEYPAAQVAFVKSLLVEPLQPAVWWRLVRTTQARWRLRG